MTKVGTNMEQTEKRYKWNSDGRVLPTTPQIKPSELAFVRSDYEENKAKDISSLLSYWVPTLSPLLIGKRWFFSLTTRMRE